MSSGCAMEIPPLSGTISTSLRHRNRNSIFHRIDRGGWPSTAGDNQT
jgi:hypothetical protein